MSGTASWMGRIRRMAGATRPSQPRGSAFLLSAAVALSALLAHAEQSPLVNSQGWFVQDGAAIWGWIQHNGWWRPGQRPNLARRSVGDLQGDVRPNRTEDFEQLTASMLRFGYPGFEHNFGLWYDRRRDAHDTARREDANVVAPFLEQPWARADGGAPAWDGLPKYDLTEFNDWYFDRLAAFADRCDARGTVLIHKYYMQHALLETPAHYVDFPWRPVNCVQETGLPDSIPAANVFYDVSDPVRRELHRAYIRKCLDTFAGNRNVVHAISEEYTGPLSFAQFWLDTVTEWEREHGKNVCIALGATKDVQDAILADPVRGSAIDVLDLRNWWYRTDGSLYAPEGGREFPGRDFDQGGRQGKVCPPEQIYRKIREYRDRYPDKGIIDAIEGDRRQNWAFLMAGGSLLARGLSYPDNADPTEYIQPAQVEIILPTYNFIRTDLARALPGMRPVAVDADAGSPVWCLDDGAGSRLYCLPHGGAVEVEKASVTPGATTRWLNPRSGTLEDATPQPQTNGKALRFATPDGEDWALVILPRE